MINHVKQALAFLNWELFNLVLNIFIRNSYGVKNRGIVFQQKVKTVRKNLIYLSLADNQGYTFHLATAFGLFSFVAVITFPQ
jgi:hypothetical protein